ncbi:unnamed protein product [Trypanosoma congolense IL3000]|uniref:WGS project CAEQ00000000 data, annotated contig 1153 n=1 Tax=Trypanosoma congolense (strain IL3000) TaxID=1068625 RepID=F9W469_TRYCI|nr:unnamed protein product [Trypanosoma congolense IL3000]
MRGECERLHKIASQGMQPQTPLDFTKVKSSFMPNPPSRTDVDELMKKNAILQALIKSLEYTIRRKEEEERDITSLLNAFRRKVADRVTDPHLRTLLSSVMFRNPERFYTGSKGEADFLQEFNEPLMNYMQELRQSDPDVYKQLIEYLQHPLAGSRNDDVCDKLIALAKQEGDRGENFRSLKRSLPVLLSSLNEAANMGSDYNFEASISRKGAVPGECDTSAFGVSHPLKQCDSPLSVFNSSSGGPANITLRSTTQMPADDKPTVEGEIYNFLKNLQTSGDINVFTAQMAPNGADEAYVRQIRSTFEFILQTRGTLVRQMAILWRRAYKGLQVVKALASSNAREIALSQKSSLKSSVNSSSPRGKSQKLGAVAIGILDELSSLVSSIISTLFTSTEKQRIEFTAL